MKTHADWHEQDLLPSHEPGHWAVWHNGAVSECSEAEVRRRLRRWQPQALVLVAPPDAPRFVTPATVPAMADVVRAAIHRRARWQVTICFVAALVAMLLALLASSRALLGWSVSFGLLGALFLTDELGALRNNTAIDERVRFLYWLKTSRATQWGAFIWTLIPTLAGAAQYTALQRLGDLTQVFHAYGVMYPDVYAGELWRLVTGPYLHYSLLHFMNNYFMLILIGTLSWVLLPGGLSLATFALGNSVGAVGQILLGGNAYDSCGGISFGINALFGLVIASSALDRRMLPHGFATLCMFIAMLGILGSEAGSADTATAGHVVALVFGALVAGARHITHKPHRPERAH